MTAPLFIYYIIPAHNIVMGLISQGVGEFFFFSFFFFYQNVTAMIDMHPVRMYTFPLGIRGKVQRKGFNSVVLALNKVTQCLLVYNLQ